MSTSEALNQGHSSTVPKVTIKTTDGTVYTADYAVSTFSLGVLQNEDVKFTPAMPEWKIESFFTFHMATYTKIFLNFPYKVGCVLGGLGRT
jgi:monoamine oxidase